LKTIYLQQNNFRSSEFGIDYIQKYTNCLNISFGQLDFLVIESATHKVLLYESYELDNVQNDKDLVGLLDTIYKKHDCLPAGFWDKIVVNISTNKQTLIPAKFAELSLESKDYEAFLKLNVQLDLTHEQTKAIHLSKQSVVSAFAYSKVLSDWLISYYPKNLTITHEIASFITGLSELSDKLTRTNFFVLLKKEHLHLVVFKGGQIEFANTFPCQTVNDFLYYVVLVTEELQIQRSYTTLHFYSTAGDRSAFFMEAKNYFGQTVLGTIPNSIQFAEDAKAIPSNALFDLFGSYFLAK